MRRKKFDVINDLLNWLHKFFSSKTTDLCEKLNNRMLTNKKANKLMRGPNKMSKHHERVFLNYKDINNSKTRYIY